MAYYSESAAPAVPARGVRAHVLVVDEDPAAQELIRTVLDVEGYRVACASGLAGGLRHVEQHRVDLVVAELHLADGSGFDLLAQLQELPVVVLTSSDSMMPRLRAFRMGADDFITKPFVPDELCARVGSVLRRVAGASRESFEHDILRIELESRRVTLDAVDVELTAREFDLLAFLAGNPGRVYTRHQLLTAIWHSSSEWQHEATVTEHVRRVRMKLRHPAGREWLQTVRGVGYRFDRRPPISATLPALQISPLHPTNPALRISEPAGSRAH